MLTVPALTPSYLSIYHARAHAVSYRLNMKLIFLCETLLASGSDPTAIKKSQWLTGATQEILMDFNLYILLIATSEAQVVCNQLGFLSTPNGNI